MVKKYMYDQVNHKFVEHKYGDLVHYEDYQKLEAELASLRQQVNTPDADGWITWAGGECPVVPDLLVRVIFRDGTPSDKDERAGAFCWRNDAEMWDIVAYRVML